MILGLPKQILNRISKRVIEPAEILSQLGVREGMSVLEMGNPIGFFTASLHNLIGETGSIIIAGPNAQSFEKLHDEIDHTHTSTVTLDKVLVGEAAPKKSLDLIILTNLLSSTVQAKNFCLNLSDYLKPSGRLAVIDWDRQSAVDITNDRAVSREEAVRLLSACGLRFERMLNLAGYHFGLVFAPMAA